MQCEIDQGGEVKREHWNKEYVKEHWNEEYVKKIHVHLYVHYFLGWILYRWRNMLFWCDVSWRWDSLSNWRCFLCECWCMCDYMCIRAWCDRHYYYSLLSDWLLTRAPLFLCAYFYLYIGIHTYIYIYTYMYIHMCIYMYVYTVVGWNVVNGSHILFSLFPNHTSCHVFNFGAHISRRGARSRGALLNCL